MFDKWRARVRRLFGYCDTSWLARRRRVCVDNLDAAIRGVHWAEYNDYSDEAKERACRRETRLFALVYGLGDILLSRGVLP